MRPSCMTTASVDSRVLLEVVSIQWPEPERPTVGADRLELVPICRRYDAQLPDDRGGPGGHGLAVMAMIRCAGISADDRDELDTDARELQAVFEFPVAGVVLGTDTRSVGSTCTSASSLRRRQPECRAGPFTVHSTTYRMQTRRLQQLLDLLDCTGPPTSSPAGHGGRGDLLLRRAGRTAPGANWITPGSGVSENAGRICRRPGVGVS